MGSSKPGKDNSYDISQSNDIQNLRRYLVSYHNISIILLYSPALICVCIVFFLQALAKLKKIPDTIKAIMERLEPELKQIVKRSTTQIADHAYQRGENLAQESQPRYSKTTGRHTEEGRHDVEKSWPPERLP